MSIFDTFTSGPVGVGAFTLDKSLSDDTKQKIVSETERVFGGKFPFAGFVGTGATSPLVRDTVVKVVILALVLLISYKYIERKVIT